MQRRVFLLLGLLLAAPAFVQANTISLVGTGQLIPNQAGQVITLVLSGPDAYSSSDVVTSINGGVGPAPFVTHVFGDPAATIPVANLAASIWASGFGGISLDPDGTSPTSTGLQTKGGFSTPGFGASTANGTYLTLTLSTIGVPAGTYELSLNGTIMTLFDENFEPFPVPLQFAPMTLSIVPEPSSVVLGMFAAAGMAAVVIRRRRTA